MPLNVPILGAPASWECPECDAALTTPTVPAKPIMHPCPGMKGLLTPMVREGDHSKHEANEREDYLGDDAGWVRLDGDGRPIMNVTTTHADGHTDVTVYAPTAHN